MTTKLAWVSCAALLVGCDNDQTVFYQAAIEGVPGIVHLGTLTPVPLTTVEEVQAQVIYGELGPTGTPLPGGVTFNLEGRGGSMCIFVDPELASWNTSVSQNDPIRNFTFPDNNYDDGDLELFGGYSVFYTGTPGQRIGNFEVPFEDALGNLFVQNLVECSLEGAVRGGLSVKAGRAVPEFCDLANTIEGVTYTIVLQTFSVPIDDNRLGYGLVVTEGTCAQFNNLFAGAAQEAYGRECIIRGESIRPGEEQGARAKEAGLPAPTWIGDERPTWPQSEAFEEAFCNETLRGFCNNEKSSLAATGDSCSWEVAPEDVSGELRRCYCGDELDLPSAGGF